MIWRSRSAKEIPGKVCQLARQLSEKLCEEYLRSDRSMSSLPRVLAALRMQSELNDTSRLELLRTVRRCTSYSSPYRTSESTASVLWRHGVVPVAIDLMKQKQDGPSVLLLEATWLLGNLVSSRQSSARDVVHALPCLLRQLTHTSDRLVQQTVWALANLAAADRNVHEQIVHTDIWPVMCLVMQRAAGSVRLLRDACWCLRTLSKNSHPSDALVSLVRNVVTEADTCDAAVTDAAWTLVNADSADETVEVISAALSRPHARCDCVSWPSREVTVPLLQLLRQLVQDGKIESRLTSVLSLLHCILRDKNIPENRRVYLRKEAIWQLYTIVRMLPSSVRLLCQGEHSCLLTVLSLLCTAPDTVSKHCFDIVRLVLTSDIDFTEDLLRHRDACIRALLCLTRRIHGTHVGQSQTSLHATLAVLRMIWRVARVPHQHSLSCRFQGECEFNIPAVPPANAEDLATLAKLAAFPGPHQTAAHTTLQVMIEDPRRVIAALNAQQTKLRASKSGSDSDRDFDSDEGSEVEGC
ncbi:MAG: hypothetical protein MHM6MM_001644 [Cercozoa sp. M6MM]